MNVTSGQAVENQTYIHGGIVGTANELQEEC